MIVSAEKPGQPIPRLQDERVAMAAKRITNGISFLTNFVFIIIMFDAIWNTKLTIVIRIN